MRRVAPLLLSLLMVLPACSQSTGGQAKLGQAQILTSAGLEVSEVQRAVARFLDAYARSATNLEDLARAVGGEDLEEWVYWLGVQNRDMTLEGQVEADRLRVLEIQGDFAAAGLDARVIFTLPDGQEAARRFQSPMFLTREGRGGRWVVFDAIRDGRSMQESIGLVRPPVRDAKEGVTVEVSSVFLFSAGTLVNLRITNGSPRPIQIDPTGSVVETGGLPVPGRASNEALQRPIGPGKVVEGMIEFQPIPLEQPPRVFGLAFQDGPRGLILQIPPEAFAEQQP